MSSSRVAFSLSLSLNLADHSFDYLQTVSASLMLVSSLEPNVTAIPSSETEPPQL